ncbi:hypothetical protein Lal_00044758 [Lupinus albus]|nr:hypothetical protein Lal_00044758 [Lupinus albus]
MSLLKVGDQILTKQDEICTHVLDYYKSMFDAQNNTSPNSLIQSVVPKLGNHEACNTLKFSSLKRGNNPEEGVILPDSRLSERFSPKERPSVEILESSPKRERCRLSEKSGIQTCRGCKIIA